MLLRNLSNAVLIGALAAVGAAQSLTGHIVDYNGAPVNNVNVILSNGAPLGTTDAAGNFTITGLRNRLYTIQLDPHNNFLDAQQFDFNVSGAATLGTVTLQPAWPVTGQFLGPNGAGLLGVNMNAYLADGTKLYTPHDGSDALGNVIIGVPANTPVFIRAVPPIGSNLIPFQTPIMTMTAPLALGTHTLPQGYAVTGTAVDEINSLPIAGAKIVTTSQLTGEQIPQITDKTGALGQMTLLLPFGAFNVDIEPPLGNLHCGREIVGMPVLNAPANLGLVRLQRGFAVSGTVAGPGGVPVAGADLDFFTTDNYKLFTPGDHTAANGTFLVILPVGTYSIRVDPKPTTGLVGIRTPAQWTVSTNMTVGTLSLATGIPFTANVVDANGQPVPKVNVNLFNPATGAAVIMTGDIADGAGHINGVVPAGTWNMNIAAPQGSFAAQLNQQIVVTSAVNTTYVMPRKDVMMDMFILAHGFTPTVPNGSTLPIMWSYVNPGTSSLSCFATAALVLPGGAEVPWIPYIGLTFPPQSALALEFQMPMPPAPANELGRVLKFVCRFHSMADLSVIETAHVTYVPQ